MIRCKVAVQFSKFGHIFHNQKDLPENSYREYHITASIWIHANNVIRVFPWFTKLVMLAFLYWVNWTITKIEKSVTSLWIKSTMTNVNLHWNLFSSQLFPIYFPRKLHKNANFINFVCYGKTRLKHYLQFRFASFRSRQTLPEAHCCMRFIAQIYFPLRAPGAEFNIQNRENCTITSGLSASLVTEGFPLMDDTIMETAAVEGNCCVRLFTGNMHSEWKWPLLRVRSHLTLAAVSMSAVAPVSASKF